MISAAARNLRIAASPGKRFPLGSWAKAFCWSAVNAAADSAPRRGHATSQKRTAAQRAAGRRSGLRSGWGRRQLRRLNLIMVGNVSRSSSFSLNKSSRESCLQSATPPAS